MSSRKVCGAHTKRGTECQAPPMANGRCRVHGGASLAGAESPTFKHGRYSQYLPQAIAAKVASFDNEDPLNLLPELNVQRALFAEYMSRFQAGYTLTGDDISLMMSWTTEITRTGERINKMRNETALTAAEVKFLAARIADVVAKYIPDAETQQRFIRDVFGESEDSRQPQLTGAGST